MWPDNQVVKVGLLHVNEDTHFFSVGPNLVDTDGDVVALVKSIALTGEVLVGHNIKFDLLYVLKNKWLTPKEVANLKIWDTQHVEYLLSGQTHTYPSLNDCAVKYGGTVKDDRIKEFWDADTPTEKIPEAMLAEYLRYDLLNTSIVYEKQRKQVEFECPAKLQFEALQYLQYFFLHYLKA